MPQSTAHCADPAQDTDALSDLLQAIRFRGTRADRMALGPGDAVSGPRGSRLVLLVDCGVVNVEVDDAGDVGAHAGQQRVSAQAGDLLMLARGVEHRLSSTSGARCLRGTYVVNEPVGAHLLDVLPPVVHVSGQGAGGDWLPLATALLDEELVTQRPGSRLMIGHILDLLLIHALRAWAAAGPRHPGWLTAAGDERLGPAIRAIHTDHARNWTVEDLAVLAHLSPSAFARRFTAAVGQPPASYVTRHRLDLAAELLRATGDPVGAVGRQVGYGSEAAFSRAFTRAFGCAPREWRQQVDTPAAAEAGGGP